MNLRLIKLLFLFVVLLFPLNSRASNTILVLGDSLSAAYGIPKQQGWVALMEREIQQKFPDYQIINASISGETTLGGKQRLAKLLTQYQPKLTIIELGANDGLRGQSIKTMTRNLAEMIESAQQQGSKVLLVKMLLPPNYGPIYTRQFAKVFDDLSQRYQLSTPPFLLEGLNNKDFQRDNLHPTAAAQPKLLGTMLLPVLALL